MGGLLPQYDAASIVGNGTVVHLQELYVLQDSPRHRGRSRSRVTSNGARIESYCGIQCNGRLYRHERGQSLQHHAVVVVAAAITTTSMTTTRRTAVKLAKRALKLRALKDNGRRSLGVQDGVVVE